MTQRFSYLSSYPFLKARALAMEIDSSTSMAHTKRARANFFPKCSIGNHHEMVSCGRPCGGRHKKDTEFRVYVLTSVLTFYQLN